MSLLRSLFYCDEDYQRVLSFTKEQCELVALKAELEINFNAAKKPGDTLMKALDRRGYNVTEFRELLISIKNLYAYAVVTYYNPQVKVAILIGNDKYQFLSKLSTPTADCETIASSLKVMGYVILTVMNTTGNQLKNILKNIFMEIPENSYCFIVYAGHGCEICNTKFMLGIDCPLENITIDHCVSENFVLKEVAVCKPDLCILIMDMCRINLDRRSHPELFSYLPYVEEYRIHKNLLIAYSTQSSESAYEVVQIVCSESIDINVPYELQPGDTDKIILGTVSQYVKALAKRLLEDLDISSLLDKVHRDVENSIMKQRPIKVQCGVDKRSLYDIAVIDNLSDIGERLREITSECGGISNISVSY